MQIDFIEIEHEGKTLYSPIIDGRKESCYFEEKGHALIYAGLLESGLSYNDSSHLGRYISAMVEGIKKDA